MHRWIRWAYGAALVVAALFELHLGAQEWGSATRYGGQGNERASGVVVDAEGNQYLAGAFESSAGFGSQTLTVTGHRDAFIGKWDPVGNLIWVQKGGGNDEDYASAITVDPSGNPIVMGTFRSATAEFGGISVTNKYARDYNSLFVAKLNGLGKAIWVQQVGGASTYDSAAIQTDSSGNIYLVACMARFANFGVTNLTGYEDILVAKYAADGSLLWAKQAGGNGYDYGLSLVVTPDGIAYVTGTFEKNAPFDQLTLVSRGLSDLFLAKYSASGNVEWVTQAGGTAQESKGVLALDHAGGVFLCGAFTGTASVGTNVLTSKASVYDQDVFFARYDSLGNVRWARQIGHPAMDADSPGGIAVNVTSNGTQSFTNIFVSGHFSYYTTVGNIALTNTTAQRMYMSKWDLDGQVLWARQAAGDSSYLACDSSLNPRVYVSGQFTDPSAWNTTWLQSAGNADLFLARLDSAAAIGAPAKPSIVEPPLAVTAAAGSSFQLRILCTGTAPVTYKWRKNGVAMFDANRVFGSATAWLRVNSCQTNDAANYTVVVSNSYGSVTSTVAAVTIQPADTASGPAWNWVRPVGGTGSDSVSCLAASVAGAVYVAGGFQNTNVVGAETLIAPKNANNIYVARYDGDGVAQWARQAGGEKTDTPTGLAADTQGNVYLTGYFSSSNATFGPYLLTNQAPGSTELFLAKYSPQGVVQWAVNANGARDDASRAIAIDGEGNVLIVGEFSSALLSLGGQVVTNIGGTDVLVAKFNPQGQLLWVRSAGYSASNDGNAVAVDAAGNVYIAGEIWGSVRFGPTELDSHFDHDTFFAKYSANGELQWARQLNSFSVAIARNLAVDANGDVIMAGYFDQTCDFEATTLVAHGSQDVFLAKFNSDGKVLWAENMGGPGTDVPRGLAVDAARNIYLTGSFEQTADLGGATLTSGGQRDVFVIACGPSGQVVWAKQAGGTRSEDGFAVAASPGGALVVGGTFASTANFDGSTYSSANSSVDGFVGQLVGTPAAARVRLTWRSTVNRLELTGGAGKIIILQGTASLDPPVTWQVLTNFVMPGDSAFWADPLGSSLQKRFYRAVIQP